MHAEVERTLLHNTEDMKVVEKYTHMIVPPILKRMAASQAADWQPTIPLPCPKTLLVRLLAEIGC